MSPSVMDQPSSVHSIPLTVAVRVRPFVRPPDPRGPASCIRIFPETNRIVMVSGPGDGGAFQLGAVFHPKHTQGNVYESLVHPLLEPFIDGQNACVVGYGASLTGKTYSLMGSALSCAMNESDFGLLQRFIRDLFQIVEVVQNRNFRITVAYVEVYQNLVRDLLNVDEAGNFVNVMFDKEGRVVLHGMLEMECRSPSEAIGCLDAGSRSRCVVPGSPGGLSSVNQSHAMFIVTLRQEWQEGIVKEQRVSTMTFVDAGSSSMMNPGLVALHNVVRSLTTSQAIPPYHTSSLTTVLRDAFGGNCRTALLCCVSAAPEDYAETYQTLHFAREATFVTNFPVFNRYFSPLPPPPQDQPVHQDLGNADKEDSSDDEDGATDDEKGEQMDSLFRLQFAAKQYEQLLEGAEELLSSVLTTLPNRNGTDDERSRIQTWICLKQECQECVADAVCSQPETKATSKKQDATKSTSEDERRRGSKVLQCVQNLGVIDEATEPGENDVTVVEDCEESVDDEDEDDDEESSARAVGGSFWDSLKAVDAEFEALVSEHTLRLADRIFSDVDHELKQVDAQTNTCPSLGLPSSYQLDVWEDHVKSEIKRLIEDAEAKEIRVKRFDSDLKILREKLTDLSDTVKLKEELKAELLKQGENAEQVKHKVEKKIKKLEKECERRKRDLEEKGENLDDSAKAEQEKLGQKIKDYEAKLKDAELVTKITKTNSEKVAELQKSLQTMHEEQEQLRRQLKEEQDKKAKLEKEMVLDREKIVGLENLVRRQGSLIKAKIRDSFGEESAEPAETKQFQAELVNIAEHQKWLDEEEDRLVQLREKSKEGEGLSKKDESHVDAETEAAKPDGSPNDDLAQASISSVQTCEKGVGTATDEADGHDPEDKEWIRGEIRNLRLTRDSLTSQRQSLDHRVNKGRVLTGDEEKKLIELDEAIEAVDAAIEYKNEVICCRNPTNAMADEAESQTSLVARLMNLSPVECKSLLYKYFLKVVDLRHEARRQECANADLENQYQEQQAYIQELSAALHHANLEKERKVAMLQKDYESKMAALMQQIGDQQSVDSSSLSTIESLTRKLRSREKELSYYKQASREYKKKLKDLLSGRAVDELGVRLSPSPPPCQSIPAHKLRPLAQAMASHSGTQQSVTTKVTREKNKLVIHRDYAGGSGACSGSPHGVAASARAPPVPYQYGHHHGATGSSPGHPNFGHNVHRSGGNDHHYGW